MAVRRHEEVISRVGIRIFHRRRERINDMQTSAMQKQLETRWDDVGTRAE